MSIKYILIFIVLVVSVRCQNSFKRTPSHLPFNNQVSQVLRNKQYIYLGENHELMKDRTYTDATLDLIIKSNKNSLVCLFSEVPSVYTKHLWSLKSKKINLQEFNNLIPKSYQHMHSDKILDLYLSDTINFYYFDLKSETDMNKRNKYMAEYASQKINKDNCEVSVFINGNHHLMNYTNESNLKVISLPKLINKPNDIKIAFIANYCTKEGSQLFDHVPDYFQKNIDNPRNSIFPVSWNEFNYFITLPIQENCG